MNKLLNTKEAARYLAVSKRKVQYLTAAGQLPVVRIGRAARIDPSDLEMFIQRAKNPEKNILDK